MYLKDNLYAIDGVLLAKKHQEITSDVIEGVRLAGKRHKRVETPLKNSAIFEDFKKVFEDKRYKLMFESPVSKKDVLNFIEGFYIENGLLLELNNMREALPNTYNHLLVVAAFAIKIALEYRPKEYDKNIVFYCGFTHDLGKTRLPIKIFNKKGKLTKKEMETIETHPMIAYLLLNYYLKTNKRLCSIAGLEHHEKLDGSGYPNGIKKVNKYAQLISPIDIMDALMTKRPYRKKTFSLRTTLDYMLEEAGKNKLNKKIVLSLIKYARKDKPDIDTMKISLKSRENLPEESTYDKYK